MRLSLNQKLLFSNIGLILGFGLVLLVQFNNSLSQQRMEIRKAFNTKSSMLGGNLAQNFYYYYHNAQAIGKNESLKTTDFEKINFFLNEIVSLYPAYDLVLVTDLKGNYISSNSLSGGGKQLELGKIKTMNLSGEEWFKKTKGGKLSEDYEKKIYGSYFGPIEQSSLTELAYGERKSGFYVATPITDEFGDALAILTTFVNVKWVSDEIHNLQVSMERQGMRGAVIKVFQDDAGLIDSNVEGEKALASIEKLGLVESADGESGLFAELFAASSPLIANEKIADPKFLDSLGWNVYVEMDSKEAFSGINSSKTIFGVSFGISLLVSAALAWLLSKLLSKQMISVSEAVSVGAGKVVKTSGEISDQANLLSASTNQQAESLHETVSSLNEMSAMVSKSASHSQNSKDLSSKSREAANQGMQTVEQMLGAIEEIAGANSEIVEQLSSNAKEMHEITNVIKEIEEKTKVINDIVFQTKLLSFNASVEAARAGEHGKGFSVVAEEVGTLAKSSGDAATEIEEMLMRSIGRVNNMVETTQSRVDGLVKKGSEKVELGRNVSGECKAALERILEQSANLDVAIEEIATASVEQSQGIQEISKAMDQLNTVTRQNSEIAKEVSRGTNALNDEAEVMGKVCDDLNKLVYGRETGNSTKSSGLKNIKENANQKNNLIQLPKEKEVAAVPVAEQKRVVNEPAPSGQDGEWEDL